MKNIVFIIFLFAVWLCQADASEISGRISTNPKEMNGQAEETPLVNEEKTETEEVKRVPGIVMILPNQKRKISETEIKKVASDKIKVLGESYFPDGSLIRGSDHKIFFIHGREIRYIPNLNELKKYRGREIIDVADEVINNYAIRKFFDGELIKGEGDVAIYVIEKEKRKHIINLDFLRRYYFNRKINIISTEEMQLYL